MALDHDMKRVNTNKVKYLSYLPIFACEVGHLVPFGPMDKWVPSRALHTAVASCGLVVPRPLTPDNSAIRTAVTLIYAWFSEQAAVRV